MGRIILYKVECHTGDETGEQGANYSMLPWDDTMPGVIGEDDGGYDYVLPAGYSVLEREGLPAIYSENGALCRVQTHNFVPLLIDESKKFAVVLEREKKILKLREDAGMTRAELAEIIEVTQERLYEWENCEKEPDMPSLRRIAATLGCAVFDLT